MGPVLGAPGFSAVGPVAGARSAIGAGVLFSTLQSAAMGGYGTTAVTLAFAGDGASVGWAVGAALTAATSNPSKHGKTEDAKK